MTATQDLSFIQMFLQASLVSQIIFVILVLISLMSWSYIFHKAFVLRSAKNDTDEFERTFWSGGDLQTLFNNASSNRHHAGPMERIFEAGMREFIKGKQQRISDTSLLLEGARRAMRAAYQREMDALESHLPFLATTGSVSPYVGLLGTVWGIMHAFRGLSNVQQATLASVAPGIAEALVATAVGLFAAIPAVVAYNRFATQADRLSVRLDSFIEEFSNILQRQANAQAVHAQAATQPAMQRAAYPTGQ